MSDKIGKSARSHTTEFAASTGLKSRTHPLFGKLKGTFTIDPDWELTKPAMPEWADVIDEKYGPEAQKS